MNIGYDINSDTGIMRLKFKKDLLDPLKDKKEVFEKYILPMLAMNDKFLLTGSLSLKLLGFEPIGEIGDFDFGLLSKFTEEDYHNLKSFFNLHDNIHDNNYGDTSDKPFKFDENAHLWQFSKHWSEPTDNPNIDKSMFFKLDIFNDEIIRNRDIITIYYDDFPIRLVHPSITLSYRMRYALDIRSSNAFKYWERMKAFIDNAKSYYNQLRTISQMIARIHEHNTNIEGDKKRIAYLRNLINTREINADNFFEKVFKESLTYE